MITENVFVTEIKLDNGTLNEFVDKGWYALNVHTQYPNEVIGNDAFLDWARDLTWIPQKHAIIIIRGVIDKETKRIINFLNEYWENNFNGISTKECIRKKVDFIIAS